MEIAGLPLHPLVVHAAVVFVPLAALGALLIALFTGARTRWGWLVVATSVVALGSTIAARVTGEAFAVGLRPAGALATHTMWGLYAPFPAGLLVLGTLAVVLAGRGNNRALQVVAAAVTVVAAVASLALIVVVGHSGATAVWGSG